MHFAFVYVFLLLKIIFKFLTVLSLHCCMEAFSSCGKWRVLSCSSWASHCSGFSCFGEGNDNPLQYSCLENSMDRGAWQAIYSPWGCKELDMTEQLSLTLTHSCFGAQALGHACLMIGACRP